MSDRERALIGPWRALPLYAARVVQDIHAASKLKEVYQREGAKVRVFPRKLRAGGAVVWLFVVIARKEQVTANERT